MFTQELHELLAPTGIDLIGKEHFDRTGAYLAIQEINSQMILQMIQTGGLDQYLHADKDEIHELIREASEIVRQETLFFIRIRMCPFVRLCVASQVFSIRTIILKYSVFYKVRPTIPHR